MADTIITYEILYELLRKEKYQNELQELPETFFKDVVNYLTEKNAILKSQKEKDSIFSAVETQKTLKQIENTKKIIKELYERRESKIINISLLNSRSNTQNQEIVNLLPEELNLLNALQGTLNQFKEGILNKLLIHQLPELDNEPKSIKTPKNESKNTGLIRILNPIPKFVGPDLNTYGPFEEEDLANIPKEIANLLIKNNKAEAIK